jgi:cold shock CspA family protein
LLEKTVRGSVTKILRKLGCGFVVTETGDEVFFGSYALDGVAIDQLEEGQTVEFDLYDLEMGRTIVARLHPDRSAATKSSRCP